MDKTQLIRLRKMHTSLVSDVRVREVLPYLIQDGILDSEDHQSVTKVGDGKSEREKTETLLLLLQKRGSAAYNSFRNALNPAYPWLIEMLDKVEVTQEDIDQFESWKQQLVTDKMLRVLRGDSHLCSRWHALAHSLGLSNQCNSIQMQSNIYMLDMSECLFRLLVLWKSQKGNQATLGALLVALREENFNCAADELEEKFQQT